jgi:hypothetical protein
MAVFLHDSHDIGRGPASARIPRGVFVRRPALAFIFLAIFSIAAPAGATSVDLSLFSSDSTPASVLDANFDFSVLGTTLTLTVTNDTNAPDDYNINEIYFNGSNDVSSLSVVSVTHSVAGNVTSDWIPLLTGVMVDGFDIFDYGMTDGLGELAPPAIGPTENLEFVFSITGTGPFTDFDFIVGNGLGYTAAAKFVNGPGDDSAYGTVPEPSTGLLLASGLLLLGARRRTRR